MLGPADLSNVPEMGREDWERKRQETEDRVGRALRNTAAVLSLFFIVLFFFPHHRPFIPKAKEGGQKKTSLP